MIENKATPPSSGLWAAWAGTLIVAGHAVHSSSLTAFLLGLPLYALAGDDGDGLTPVHLSVAPGIEPQGTVHLRSPLLSTPLGDVAPHGRLPACVPLGPDVLAWSAGVSLNLPVWGVSFLLVVLDDSLTWPPDQGEYCPTVQHQNPPHARCAEGGSVVC